MLLPQLVKRQGNKFIINLNKDLYRRDIIDKAVLEDKEWVKGLPARGGYWSVELMTSDEQDVLIWLNYLLYLHKIS